MTALESMSHLNPTVSSDSPSNLLEDARDQTLAAQAQELKFTRSELFLHNREALTVAIDACKSLLRSFEEFNEQHWTLRYPLQFGPAHPHPITAAAPLASSSSVPPASMPSTPQLKRSTTMQSAPRPSMHARAMTNAEEMPSVASPNKNMSILSLDLKLGEHAVGPSSLPALIPSLSQSTLAQLLSRRFATALKHLHNLRTRVQDTDSKVLVTGDLNAGKSTFVNALLRRDVMPVDQQPCTSVFCEVVDASLNGGVEEAHAIKADDLVAYHVNKPETFARFSMKQLDDACIDGHDGGFALVRIYLSAVSRHNSDSTEESAAADSSFVSNGIVDIALIDAPGLNRDTLSTTALFSRQAEIDVVVFLVNAENHFTLSAKEFLWNAAREKAYVFVVVNKFGGIRDKARCIRVVGDQLKQLSPATWESRSELVHFVEAGHPQDQPEWTQLEASLREFVLQKRSRSKLLPAKTYLLNLLSDLELVSQSNVEAADAELTKALADLEILQPAHERLTRLKHVVNDELQALEESAVGTVKAKAKAVLDVALTCLGKGELPVVQDKPLVHASVKPFDDLTELPPYPGVSAIWEWADDVKEAFTHALEGSIRLAEEHARNATVDGVVHITNHMSEQYLPPSSTDKTEENRVFRPDVMFAKRRRAFIAAQRSRRGVAALGLKAAPDASPSELDFASDVQLSLLDLLDLDRLWSTLGSPSKLAEPEIETAGALSVISVGFGALTMFGSRAVGVRSFVDTIARIAEFAGSKTARKWATPVIGALTVALAAYIIIDLPRAVPRNIGRKLQLSLNATALAAGETSFATAEADRIAKETRKVLRLASWDLCERFRVALEKSEHQRRAVEGLRDRSKHALEWLVGFHVNLEKERDSVESVCLNDLDQVD